MVKKVINVGVEGNDATGDPIREAFIKTNENFNELYSFIGQGDGISLTAIQGAPTELLPNTILSVVNNGSEVACKSIEGSGITITQTDSKITFTASGSKLIADNRPVLANYLNAAGWPITGLPAADSTESVAIASNLAAENQSTPSSELRKFAVSKGYVDDTYVIKAGDTMTGPLNVPANATGTQVARAQEVLLRKGGNNSQMQGPLILERDPDASSDPLTAVTKNYVDTSSFSSRINLFVSTNGDDIQIDTLDNKKGRALAYAFKTVNTAARWAEQLIKDSVFIPGPYVKKMTYNNGANSCAVVSLSAPTSNPEDPARPFYTVTVSNDFANSDARIGNDIRAGHIIRGRNSGALGLIKIVGPVIDNTELYTVSFYDSLKYIPGEPLEYADPVKELQITINVESGNYYENYPIRLAANVSIVGDEMRRTVIRPKSGRSASKWADMFFRRDITFDNLTLVPDPDPTDPLVSANEFGRHYLTRSDKPLYSGTIANSGNFYNTAQLIFRNKSFIIAEVIEFINAKIADGGLNGFSYNEDVCRRDVGIIVDAVAYDVMFNSNFQSIKAGMSYYRAQSIKVTSTNQKEVTLGTLNQLQALLENIADSNGTAKTRVTSRMTLIKNIFNNGLTSVPASIDWPNPTTGLDVSYINAKSLILSNKPFFEEELLSYLNREYRLDITGSNATSNTFSCLSTAKLIVGMPYTFNGTVGGITSGATYYIKKIINSTQFTISSSLNGPTLPLSTTAVSGTTVIMLGTYTISQTDCRRDVGYIVDALHYDLTYGGNTQTINAGVAYYNGTTNELIVRTDEKSVLIDVYNKFKEIAQAITSGGSYAPVQTTVARVNLSGFGGSNTATTNVGNLLDNIKTVIINFASQPAIVYPTTSWVDPGLVTIGNNIISSKSSLQNSIITWINQNRFVYNDTLCKRDMGLILDSLVFDLLRGGYYQVLDVGNSFFLSASALLVIQDPNLSPSNPYYHPNGQLAKTDAAFAYMNTIILKIIENLSPDIVRQATIAQKKLLEFDAEENSSTAINDLMSFLRKIINRDASINPAKNNEEMDVFLVNDANIVRLLSCQRHGGFMCVLDPEGQILSKSPYIQTVTSVSQSNNLQRFAGGKFVDGFSGNLKVRISARTNNTTFNIAGIDIGSNNTLKIRRPQTPCSFFIQGKRFSVDYISEYDPVNGTATVHLNPNTPDANSYTGTVQLINVNNNIEFLTAGNKSMLSADFTQLNDMGYGLVAINGALIEAVSVFTYYCHTAYYSASGGQIRSVNGSCAHGNIALKSDGADPLEVPTLVNLTKDMTIGATVFSGPVSGYTDYRNKQTGTILYVENLTTDYPPLNQSEIEIIFVIDGKNTIIKYEIANAVKITVPSGDPSLHRTYSKSLYQLNLSNANIGNVGQQGLQDIVTDNTKVIIRQNLSLWVSGISTGLATRPSTALLFDEFPSQVYRCIGFSPINANTATFTWIWVDPFSETVDENSFIIDITFNAHGLTIGQSVFVRFRNDSGSTAFPSDGIYTVYKTPTINTFKIQSITAQSTNTNLSGTLFFSTTIDQVQALVREPFFHIDFTVFHEPNPTSSYYLQPNVGGDQQYGIIGSTKIAVRAISPTYKKRLLDATSYVNTPGAPIQINKMIFGWNGIVHTITNYIEPSGSVPYGTVVFTPALTAPVGVVEGNFVSTPNIRSNLKAGSSGNITVRISTVRVSGHDMLDIGTGSYADTNFPQLIYGDPIRSKSQSSEAVEIGKGRVFYATTDQDGNFRVGKFFKVDQGTGTVTFAASIAISNLNGLGFKRGVAVSEFSVDDTMTDNATDKVPVEQALRGYIERRLGLTHNGALLATDRIIPPGSGGFLALNGLLPMRGNLNMTDPNSATQYRIIGLRNIDQSSDGFNATNKNYVDLFLKREGGVRTDVHGFTMANDSSTGIGNISMNNNKITLLTYPTDNGDAANKLYVDFKSNIKNSDDVEIKTGTTVGTAADKDLFVYNNSLSKWVNVAPAAGADISFTFSDTHTLDIQIKDGVITNTNISSSPTAKIAQEKLNLLSSNTGTVNSYVRGVCGFDSTFFTSTGTNSGGQAVDGFISLANNSITYNRIQTVNPKKVLGTPSGSAKTTVTELDYSAVVEGGDGLYKGMFGAYGSGSYALLRTALDTYNAVTVGSADSVSSIILRDSEGKFTARKINVITSITTNGSDIITFRVDGTTPIMETVGTISVAKSNVLSQTLSDSSGTINWDTSLGQIATVTLSGTGRTIAAPTNLKVGTYILHVVQGGLGNRTISSWNSIFKWPAGVAPVLTTTAGSRDVFSFICDGTFLYGSYIPDAR